MPPVRRIETVNPCIPKAMQQKCHKQHSRAGDQVKEVHMSTLHSFAGYLTIQIETVPSDKRLCPHYFKKKNRLILSGARRFFYWSLYQRYNTHTHKKDDRKKSYFVIWVIPLSGSSFNRLSFTMAPPVSYHKMISVHSCADKNSAIPLHAKSLALTGRGFFDE